MNSGSTHTIRLVQGLNYPLHGCEVGVMNVYQESGAALAHLSVYDPSTSTDHDVFIRATDELAIGDRRYLVVTVVPAAGGDRAWLEIAARSPAPPAYPQ